MEYDDITMFLRDSMADDLKVCTKTSGLTRLLLSRQIQGRPGVVRQYALLMRNLDDSFEKMEDDVDNT